MQNHLFTILSLFAILFGIGVAMYLPVLGFSIIIGVLIAAIAVLIYRLMRL
jgi:hypothetical protein